MFSLFAFIFPRIFLILHCFTINYPTRCHLDFLHLHSSRKCMIMCFGSQHNKYNYLRAHLFTRLFVCEQDISKHYGRIRTTLGGQVGCVTRINWFDFGEDPNPDMRIFYFIKWLAWIGSLRSPLRPSLQRLTSQICCVVMIYTNRNTSIYFVQIYL